jgi:SAM-dependent methyltransferase
VARLLGGRAVWSVLRAGDLPARSRAIRDGQAALRLSIGAAAVSTGLVDALAEGPRATADLGPVTGAQDEALLLAWLRVATAAGLLRKRDGRWALTRRGRALLSDPLVRATHEAFAGFHTGLYRELGPVLGGRRRRDVAEQGELIARLSGAFEPLVLGELTRRVTAAAPRRVLDVGCGAGVELATMLAAAPDASGTGVDVDPAVVPLAEATLREWGLADRARVLAADVRALAADGPDALGGPVDVALLANVVYYLPPAERVPLLHDVAGLLSSGGTLLVVTTVADADLSSRHFDLLLRAQEGQMRLPGADELAGQLREAGLRDVAVDRVLPRLPFVVAAGTRAG